MREAWQRVAELLEARSLRERALVLATTCIALVTVATLAGLDPLAAQRTAHEEARAAAESQADRLEAASGALRTRLGQSPEEEARRELARLEREVAALDARIAEAGAGLVSPSEMNAALAALLAERPALRVRRLETLESEALLPDPDGGASPLYRHRGVLVLEGRWPTLARALRALEDVPWHIRWDAVDYAVDEHPRARMTVRFHTLGTRREWVGG